MSAEIFGVLARISRSSLEKQKAPLVGRGSAKLQDGRLPFEQLIITPPSDTPLHFR
jgi:hypothetical protein